MKKIKSSAKAQIALLCASVAVLLALVVMPLCALFVKAFQNTDGSFVGFGNFGAYFGSPNLVASIGNTLFVSGISTLIAVLLALGFAYALSRTNIRCKGFHRHCEHGGCRGHRACGRTVGADHIDKCNCAARIRAGVSQNEQDEENINDATSDFCGHL